MNGQTAAPIECAAGLRLGRYELVEKVGGGHNTEVWRANDVPLRRTVAVKLLTTNGGSPNGPRSNDAESVTISRDAFVREVRATAALDHPNLPVVYDAGPMAGLLTLVTSWIDGVRLDDKLVGLALPPDLAVHIVEGLADALHSLHQRGVAHGDVQPSNVILRHSPPVDAPVLVDLGSARDLNVTSTNHPRRLAYPGHVEYAAPELARGGRPDRRSDQYALACVAYACFAGVSPHAEVGPPSQILRAHGHRAIRSLSERSTELGGRAGAVDAALQRALARDPHDRFATVHDLALALRTAVAGSPRSSRATSNGVGSEYRTVAVAMPTATRWDEPDLFDSEGTDLAESVMAAPPRLAGESNPALVRQRAILVGAWTAVAAVVGYTIVHPGDPIERKDRAPTSQSTPSSGSPIPGSPTTPSFVTVPLNTGPAPITATTGTQVGGTQVATPGTQVGGVPSSLERQPGGEDIRQTSVTTINSIAAVPGAPANAPVAGVSGPAPTGSAVP